MDPALKAGLVVDVLQEIGLDVDDGAQLRRPVEPRLRHVALADQQSHLGQKDSKRSAGMRPAPSWTAKFAEALQPRPDLRLEDLVRDARGCGSITIRGLAIGLLPKRCFDLRL